MFDGKQLTVTDGLLAVGQAAPAAADHALDVQCEWTSVGRPASAPNAHLARGANCRTFLLAVDLVEPRSTS